MDSSITNDLRQFVREKVESGEIPSKEAVLQEALRRFRQNDQNVCTDDGQTSKAEDFIDWEVIESCARQIDGQDVPSIDDVRQSLSKIRGSMAQAVIEERG